MRIEFIIAIPCQRPQGEEIDARGDSLPLPQRLFDLGFKFPRQRRCVLSEELENIVADKIMIGAIGDAEDVGDADGVELDGEGVVGDDEVLDSISICYHCNN